MPNDIVPITRDLPKFCVLCNYWGLVNGECKRRAPTRDLECRPCWPLTSPLDKCGEWEPAPQTEIEERKAKLKQ